MDGFCIAPTPNGLRGAYIGAVTSGQVRASFSAKIEGSLLTVSETNLFAAQSAEITFEVDSVVVHLQASEGLIDLRFYPGRRSLFAEAANDSAFELVLVGE